MSSTNTQYTASNAPSVGSTHAASVTHPPAVSSMDSSYSKDSSSSSSSMIDHGKASYHELASHPTTLTCSNPQCASTMSIPPSTWSWTCTNNHVNSIEISSCTSCKAPKEQGLSWPALMCSKCHTVTAVPGSQAGSVMSDVGSGMAATLKSFVNKPTTFNCGNCNVKLVAPSGPWQCQNCSDVNTATAEECIRCHHDKRRQRVLCGGCRQATSIPENQINDFLRSGLLSGIMMAKTAYYDVTKQPTIACPSCKHPVAMPKSFQMDMPAHSSIDASGKLVGTASVAPTGVQTPTSNNQSHKLPMTCSNCHNDFQVTASLNAEGVSQFTASHALPASSSSSAASSDQSRSFSLPIASVAPQQ